MATKTEKGQEAQAPATMEEMQAMVQQMLDEACLEVVQEDPLGAYSVDFIRYDVTPIVSYYEAAVEITYRRTREQVASIVDATGAAAIRSELSRALSAFSTEVVLRISYFEEDEAYIQQLVRDAYLTPEFAERFRTGDLPMEIKSENIIHRVKGVAEHPRPLERVPAGVCFELNIALKVYENDAPDLKDWIFKGLRLVELDALGGCSSRGCGQVAFEHLAMNGEPVNLSAISAF